MTEFLDLMREVRSGFSHWHILVGGSKSVPKLIIRDLILKNQDIALVRTTSGSVLETVKDLAAILTGLDENSILEVDAVDEMFSSENSVGEILYTALTDFQIDVLIGKGEQARSIKLDLQKFCSIFYCKDINALPVSFLKLFNCCLTLDD
jgi:Holliday junction DNA helicase RuvB